MQIDWMPGGSDATFLVGMASVLSVRFDAAPGAILVVFDKRGMTEFDDVPVYSLFSILLIG
ncbi:MAG: hypothetical protein LBU24_03950 [Methanocalculaceae archaeon]|nr:hypothetical protein [Methanocalculaceae archaeon]